MDGENVNICKQHEQGMIMQEVFRKQVKSLTEAISEIGNPFVEDPSQLLALDTSNCANKRCCFHSPHNRSPWHFPVPEAC